MNSVVDILRDAAPSLIKDAQISSSYLLIRCPFHKEGGERTPSCSVSTMKPVFFCHACSTNGHLSKLLHKIGVLPDIAKEVIEDLAFQAETAYSTVGPFKLYTGVDPFRGRFVLDEDLLDEFRLKPADLTKDGFKENTLLHFEVGFDFDRYRIIYPLRNIYGELVGLSGRTVIGAEPRYKLYRTELIEDAGLPEDYSMDSVKEALLWHGQVTYPFLMKTEDPVVITEGFKAAMWIWQAGIHDVIALIGAYCSDIHVELLARTNSPIILFLDNNPAGITGTAHAGKKLLEANKVYCATYPDRREQPDDLTPTEVKAALRNAKTYRNWREEHRNVIHESSWKRQGRNWELG
jgi:DNA primase